MEEDTQEPTAPEGAPSASSTPAVEAPAIAIEAAAPAEQEASAGSPSEPATPDTPVVADWRHLLGLQAVEAPAPGWAERDDYAAEFAKELSTRAARFVRSVDDSIVLSSDGVMRWLGDPVARLVAGEKTLAPRVVLLADEALGGDEREAAQNRAGLWLAAHVRKLLGPLIALEEGAELPEAARALGAKVGEALGVLERERVRDEVRALDQTTRGAFRKLGVRFGSLYIYVPQLLKPGPRALCTQLWMLMRGAETGADQLLAFASAGRTSFGNDGSLSPEANRVAGFRLCGERVVRVDIVERLSDLIRAAMPDHMRGGSRAPSEAHGFVVTPQMTSLTGCSGDAFASILRSLNFEPVKVGKAAFEAARRKAPTEPIKAVADVMAPEAVAESEDSAVAETHGEAETQNAAVVEAHEATAPPEAVEAPEAVAESEDPAVAETHGEAETQNAAVVEAHEATAPPEAVEAPEMVTPEAAATVETIHQPSEAEAGGESVEVSAATVAEIVETPDEEIEVWRPARRHRAPQRPPRAERQAAGQNRRPQRAPDVERPAVTSEPALAEPPKRRDETPRRFEGKGDKRNRDERNREERREFTPRRDNRPADPDSPFAKLAALKPLLEQRDKRN